MHLLQSLFYHNIHFLDCHGGNIMLSLRQRRIYISFVDAAAFEIKDDNIGGTDLHSILYTWKTT